MDILTGEDFYEEHFNFVETTPINDNFEFFGTDNKIMMLSSGSYFVFVLILIIRIVAFKYIHKIVVCFPRNHYSRVLGMYIYRKNYWQELKNQNQKLFLENFFAICFAVLVGIVALSECKNYSQVFNFFKGAGNILN